MFLPQINKILYFIAFRMSYEAEQAKLQKLWEEVDEVEISFGTESENEPSDYVSERSEDSATEQEDQEEAEKNEEGEDDEESDTKTRKLPCYIAKDKTTRWKKHPYSTNVRTRSVNIITHLPGVKGVAKVAKTITDCWHLFFDEVMLNDIVRYTNQRISLQSTKYNDSSKYVVKTTTLLELKAVIGLLYLAGLFRSNRQNLEDLWNTDGTGVDFEKVYVSPVLSSL